MVEKTTSRTSPSRPIIGFAARKGYDPNQIFCPPSYFVECRSSLRMEAISLYNGCWYVVWQCAPATMTWIIAVASPLH